MPSSEAINRGPQPVLRRSSQTRSWSASSVSEGWWWGAEERSRRQLRSRRSASPASRQRVTQVWAVDFATFEAAAAASNERPPSSTSATRRRLPFGVSGALRCCIRVLLEVVSFEHPQPLGGPGSISLRSERGEARQLEGGADVLDVDQASAVPTGYASESQSTSAVRYPRIPWKRNRGTELGGQADFRGSVPTYLVEKEPRNFAGQAGPRARPGLVRAAGAESDAHQPARRRRGCARRRPGG